MSQAYILRVLLTLFGEMTNADFYIAREAQILNNVFLSSVPADTIHNGFPIPYPCRRPLSSITLKVSPRTGMWLKRTNLCKSMLKIMFFQGRAYILRAPTCTGWNETERSSFLNEVVTNRLKHNIGGNNDFNDSNYN